MRAILVLLFLLFFQSSPGQEDIYYVIHVEGNVTIGEAKNNIKTNDPIKKNAKINYTTLKDFIVVSNLKGEALCLYPNKSKTSSKGFWEQLSVGNLKSLDDLTSRGEASESYLFLKKGVLLNPKKIKVVDVPTDVNSFYYFRYCDGKKMVTKKAPIDEHQVVRLDADVLKFKKGNFDDCDSKDLELYCKKPHEDVLELLFYLQDTEGIKEELDLLKNLYKNQLYSEDIISEKLEYYLEIVYGADITIEDLYF